MGAEFICPCCGFEPEYSDEFARKVVKIMADYFRVKSSDVFAKNKNGNVAQNRARSWAIFFIRRFTGAGFKTISVFFGYPIYSTKPATIYKRVEDRIAEGGLSKRHEMNKLKRMLVSRLEIELDLEKIYSEPIKQKYEKVA